MKWFNPYFTVSLVSLIILILGVSCCGNHPASDTGEQAIHMGRYNVDIHMDGHEYKWTSEFTADIRFYSGDFCVSHWENATIRGITTDDKSYLDDYGNTLKFITSDGELVVISGTYIITNIHK